MKAVRFSRFGRASEVAELVEIPEPAQPGPGEVLIEVEVAPINPSDLLHFEGRYAQPASLPAFAGAGVLGRVARLGTDVQHLKPDDRVIVVNTQRRAWCDRFVWSAARLIPLPEACLLYTSDAADDLTRVDLGGRRIIKKKTKE